MSKTYDTLMDAEKEKQGRSGERLVSRILKPDKVKTEPILVMDSPREKMDKLKLVTGPGENGLSLIMCGISPKEWQECFRRPFVVASALNRTMGSNLTQFFNSLIEI